MPQDKRKLNPAILFALKFILLFTGLYGFYLVYLSASAPGGKLYIPVLANHFNFVTGLRYLLIETSSHMLQWFGFVTKTNTDQMLVVGHIIIHVGYDCLGFGVMAFITAFVIAYPKPLKSKVLFYIGSILGLQILNIIRFMLLALYWTRNKARIIDHHLIFDIIIYLIIAFTIYLWVNGKPNTQNAANRPVGL